MENASSIKNQVMSSSLRLCSQVGLPCYLVVSSSITVPRQCCNRNLFCWANLRHQTLPLAMASGHRQTLPCQERCSNQLFVELYSPRSRRLLNISTLQPVMFLISLGRVLNSCWPRTRRMACFRAWIIFVLPFRICISSGGKLSRPSLSLLQAYWLVLRE